MVPLRTAGRLQPDDLQGPFQPQPFRDSVILKAVPGCAPRARLARAPPPPLSPRPLSAGPAGAAPAPGECRVRRDGPAPPGRRGCPRAGPPCSAPAREASPSPGSSSARSGGASAGREAEPPRPRGGESGAGEGTAPGPAPPEAAAPRSRTCAGSRSGRAPGS
ncbi:uncharacterized protein GJ701_000691 isoform 1-T7 [Geothlypis trichas]